jgi:hypothetical protein
MYFTKSVRNVKIAFLYFIKHVKILSYKVTKLHFLYDIYIRHKTKNKTKTETMVGVS